MGWFVYGILLLRNSKIPSQDINLWLNRLRIRLMVVLLRVVAQTRMYVCGISSLTVNRRDSIAFITSGKFRMNTWTYCILK